MLHRDYGLTIATLGTSTNAHPFHLNAARFSTQNVDRQDPSGTIHPIGSVSTYPHMGEELHDRRLWPG